MCQHLHQCKFSHYFIYVTLHAYVLPKSTLLACGVYIYNGSQKSWCGKVLVWNNKKQPK